MKRRVLILLLTAVLALSVMLTACGDKDQGASPDSATADTATPDSSSAVSSSASSSAASSSAASKADTSSEPEKKASSAPAAVNNGGNGNENNDTDNKQEQKSSSAPANNNNNSNNNKSSSSQQSSSKASPASKASSGNPAYKDGEKPSYTISMTNKNTKKSYSVGCSYSKDDDKLVTTTFYLPGGDYAIDVYKYTEEKDKGDPEATGAYQNDIKEKERRSIRVTYNTETGKIKVEEMKSERDQ